MPVRLNPNRPKRFRAQYRIRNWREYEAGLKRRGDLTLWLDEAAIAEWSSTADHTGRTGALPIRSQPGRKRNRRPTEASRTPQRDSGY